MDIHAVITGDIIGSSKLKSSNREELLNYLNLLFEEVSEYVFGGVHIQVEIYRGDSFQMVLRQPKQALLIGLSMRAKLRSLTAHEENDTQNYWDARISIGIGDISFWADKITASDGKAFQLSGRGLDDMKKKQSLSIRTIWPEVNEELEIECALSETIINRWTISQAKVIYPYLLKNKTQKELAKEFDITQGAVSQRLNEAGNVDAIKLFIQRYEKLISSRL